MEQEVNWLVPRAKAEEAEAEEKVDNFDADGATSWATSSATAKSSPSGRRTKMLIELEKVSRHLCPEARVAAAKATAKAMETANPDRRLVWSKIMKNNWAA